MLCLIGRVTAVIDTKPPHSPNASPFSSVWEDVLPLQKREGSI